MNIAVYVLIVDNYSTRKIAHMIPRIKNNFIRPTGTGESWTLDIKPFPTKSDNYFVESCRAAEEIYDLAEGPLHVMYSGGIDSEYALNIFLHLGIDITPVIVKISPNYNNHDINYALKFCQNKNLTPQIIDIDFDDFVNSGKFTETNHVAKTSVIARATTCYALELVDGSVICGEGDPTLVKDPTTGTWYYHEWEHSYSLENYMDAKGIDGTGFFNGYTPAMMRAFLIDPRMQDLAGNQITGKTMSHSSKYVIYNRHSNFGLAERPKYHGWEKILNSPIALHPDLIKSLDSTAEYNGHFQIDYYNLIC